MSLEILHNRAEHTHENEQFRRFALELKSIFSQRNWEGILIGNPFNDNYHRFRADAILCYNHGIILIDFKDYKGTIILPDNVDGFQKDPWNIENNIDKGRIEIKAGSHFNNPFRQLKAYRQAFYEIVEHDIFLNSYIDPSRVCIANVFSGPLDLKNDIPRSLPYYKIIQENDIAAPLYEFASKNAFTLDIADTLKKIFPAEKWDDGKALVQPSIIIDTFQEIEKDVEKELNNFLKDKKSGVFVLESMNIKSRDAWMKHLLAEATNFGIPQIELWGHSARICKKITDRTRTEVNSIYKTIYGGISQSDEEEVEKDGENENSKLLEIIPIKTNEYIDENALIILHEAHLINRSLNQSDLLRFGSGRLLEDIFKFLNLEKSNRKVICIGDPYSLSFGKNEDAALNIETLSELFTGTINHHRDTKIQTDYDGKIDIVYNIAKSIEDTIFNELKYNWNSSDLYHITKQEVEIKLKKWFSEPKLIEPKEAILMYSKRDAKKTNLWIKNNCLNNSTKFSKGDLLIANNNVNIPDDTGFNQPKKVINGMYFTLNEIKQSLSFPIKINQSVLPINLNFIKINVKCLNLNGIPETDVWMLENHFISNDGLSKEEKIAFRVFVNRKLNEQKGENPFVDSAEFKLLKQDKAYIELSNEEKEALVIVATNYNLPKDKKIVIKTNNKVRKEILAKCKAKYDRRLLAYIRENDPFVNAVFLNYGWALTVHKALGSSFNETIINSYQGESKGINNAEYFRWLYTSIATTENLVSIINPQEINPLMNCEFEDSSNGFNEVKETKRGYLKFQNFIPKNIYSNKVADLNNENVIGTICTLTKQIEPKGYILESVQKKSDYLTKVIYSIPQSIDKKCFFNIDNKGEKDQYAVSNVRIDKLENEEKEIIEEVIASLFVVKNLPKEDFSLEIPNDFRKVIYSKWSKILKENNYQLKLLESHNNQDIFSANNNESKIKFRVWYGTSEKEKTKGFINKIVVLEKSEVDLCNKLKSWLM
ncbi:hypothetical protein H4V97_000044 [Flavobacterium sp. CG_23.5]|uniref:nuclease-related domain-containing protein n=1 Tax=Flavobacterium sp. CG_23.5 TaxID=2760708 RepID=UPI001AE8FFF1|nr:NERD domain-containing protein [Flavobacterium sp. CG_23.5]MBP2281726.1 hypothetical protein [Flavobacterium sp. CG_23.5]